MHDDSPDEAQVLSYGDVVLRASDVRLLQGPHWLNDQVISFSFEHAALDEFKQLISSGRVLLVPPAVTLLLSTLGPSEAAIILDPLQVQDKDLVLFAVNDSTDIEQAGAGTHWTLLLYCRQQRVFKHYDSAPGEESRAAATRLYEAVRASLAPGGGACPLEHVRGMPLQQNSYDCGVYLLAAAHHILTAAAATANAAAAAAAASATGTGAYPPPLELDLVALHKSLGTALTPASVRRFRERLLGQVQELQLAQQQREQCPATSR